MSARRGSKTTEEQRKTIVAEYIPEDGSLGLPASVLCAKYGISSAYLSILAKRYGKAGLRKRVIPKRLTDLK